MSRPAELGDIFGTPDGEVVRVTRVTITVTVIGGPRDGETQRLRGGVPDDWSRYPRA
jgi:hypothetical protein